ncbi:MAG: CreA family protein [Alphaproteobacteria bacterium]
MSRRIPSVLGVILSLGFGGAVDAEEIGSVSTVWKMVGPNHKITVEVFDDPDLPNVSCWVSRPVTGGISGAVGLAEDPSNGSIICHQRGPVHRP